MTLHEWIYEIICQICLDREYIYPCYIRNFTAITEDIFAPGACQGKLNICGIKSDFNALLNWKLDRIASFAGPNTVMVECRIINKCSGEVNSNVEFFFDIRTGESI